MPSSTSSSERELPGGNWGATWLVAIAVFACLTTWAERAAREAGQRPSVVDDRFSWAFARHHVGNDRHVVAFVGTSRMMLAYDADAFHQAAPDLRGVQLAINAMPAIGVLEDLAADESFRGIAIVDVVEWDMANADPTHAARKEWVEPSRKLWRAPGAVANRWLAGLVQEHLALLALGGRSVVTQLGRGKAPVPTLVTSARDRTSKGNYSLAGPGILDAKAKNRLSNFDVPQPSPQDWLAHALVIEPLIARIRARGGDVVIVRMPTSGRLDAGFQTHYPRAQYWDAFAAKTSAHAIHFRDVPAMQDLSCPDEMHLDQSSQGPFTRALIETLRANGVFANR